MQKKFKDKGVVLVALSDEPRSKVAPYISNHKLPYIVGGSARETLQDYKIRGFPTMYLVDPQGKIAWVGHPMEAEGELDTLLKSNPPKKKSIGGASSAAADLKKAAKLLKDKKYVDALTLYEKVAAGNKGTKFAKQAQAEIKKIKSNSTIMARIDMARAERKGRGLLAAARALAKCGETKDAIRYYDRIIKECADTEYATAAEEELEKLKGGSSDES